MKKILKFLAIILVFLVLVSTTVSAILYNKTGFLNPQNIDERDKNYWEYDENGVIKGAEAFELDGKKDTCWILVHGYGSSPNEMKELGEKINSELGDYVYAIRLKGHAELPSHLLNYSAEDWYEQVEEKYNEMNKECRNINAVGSSMGGAVVMKLAEEKDIKNLYLTNPFLYTPDKWYYLFSVQTWANILGDSLGFSKKSTLGGINDPEGLTKHIAYWNTPILPVKNSFEFVENVNENLDKITATTLIFHSPFDKTADIGGSFNILEKISSVSKKMMIFDKGSHMLLMDYDRAEIIRNIYTLPSFTALGEPVYPDPNDALEGIIAFEKENR